MARLGSTLDFMSTVLRAIVVVLVAGFVALALSALSCEVFQANAVCGHNIGMLVILYFLAGLVFLPLAFSLLSRPSNRPVAAPLCSKCGAAVTFEASSCTSCGFVFGGPNS